MAELAIETRKLSRTYDGVVAVDAIDMAIAPGQIHGFIGPNGAGKTTTIRMLATVLPPSSGEAFVMGRSILDDPEGVRRSIGFVPDWFAGAGASTVHEYLDFFARACGLKGAKRRSAVEEVERITGLDALKDKLITGLSRGMQQRLTVGRALVDDPPVLLMDEPAANLDPKARIEFKELVRTLAGRGKAILISSHILPELSEICDSATIIEKGRILASGPIREIAAGAAKGRLKVKVRSLGSKEELEKALAAVEGASGIEQAGPGVEFSLEGGETEAAEILKKLVGAGVPVVEYRAGDGGLESIFMALTESGRKEEAAK